MSFLTTDVHKPTFKKWTESFWYTSTLGHYEEGKGKNLFWRIDGMDYTGTLLSGLGFILLRGPSDLDLVSVDWELIFESQVHIARV